MSNKLLMGLLLTVLLFITAMLVTARFYVQESEAGQEMVAPPVVPEAPAAPSVPANPAPPASE